MPGTVIISAVVFIPCRFSFDVLLPGGGIILQFLLSGIQWDCSMLGICFLTSVIFAFLCGVVDIFNGFF